MKAISNFEFGISDFVPLDKVNAMAGFSRSTLESGNPKSEIRKSEIRLDGDHFQFRINFLFEHTLNSHQSAGQ